MRSVTAHSAGGVIVDPLGHFALTARRSFRGELQWGLPKGLVERGEDPASAALREAAEETGLEVEILRPLHTIDYWYVQPAGKGGPPTRVHKFVHYYLMRATGGDPTKHDIETEEVALLSLENAVARVSFDNERAVIRAAAAGLEE